MVQRPATGGPATGRSTSVVTPGAVAGIVEGASPNQCDVQDPNDPSYNPAEGGVEPGGDVNVARGGQYEGGGVVLLYYDATLNESNENGPGVSGMTGVLGTSQFGDVDQELAFHDGEKEYAVDPRVRYQDNGTTAFAENDIRMLNKRLGVVVDCDGEECQPGTRGLPQFVDYPAFPAPTGE